MKNLLDEFIETHTRKTFLTPPHPTPSHPPTHTGKYSIKHFLKISLKTLLDMNYFIDRYTELIDH